MAAPILQWDDDDLAMGELVERFGGADDLALLLSSVLPDRLLRMHSLTQGISGASVFLAYPERPDSGIPLIEAPAVVKLGPQRLLKVEMANYHHWSALMTDPRSFPLLAPSDLKETDEPGVIVYRKVGETTIGSRLREACDDDDSSSINSIVTALFGLLCDWHEHSRVDFRMMNGGGIYSFAVDPFDEFERQCARLCQQHPEDHRVARRYRSARGLWAKGLLSKTRVILCASHGDLNTENVLVDHDNNLTLIDFATAGSGHFLRDIATLEAHLLSRILVPDDPAELSMYIDSVRTLTQARCFEADFEESRSAVETLVVQLRTKAWRSLMRERPAYAPQYTFALLRHAVRNTIRVDGAMTDAQRWAAASLACACLDALDDWFQGVSVVVGDQ